MSDHDVHILVNGNRCKQYRYKGKTYIEAKDGSNYEIEIKNNSWNRILAVSSVDGLNVITGEKASTNGPGYVIDTYSSMRIDGFRYSNDKVAKFEFTMKGRGDSYAANKGDQQNVGVIGVRLYNEKVKPAPVVQPVPYPVYPKPYNPWDKPWKPWHDPYDPWWDKPWNYTTIWCGTGSTIKGRVCSAGGTTNSAGGVQGKGYSCSNIPTENEGNETYDSCLTGEDQVKCSSNEVLRGFDSATKWGDAKESHVVNVDFERGIIALSLEIYYATRESLIQMGVPISNNKQVSGFPSAFPENYAKPPKGWQG